MFVISVKVVLTPGTSRLSVRNALLLIISEHAPALQKNNTEAKA